MSGQPWEEDDAEPDASASAEAPAGALTCPPREQLHWGGGGLDGRRRFEIEISAAVRRFGANHCGMWTCSPGDKGTVGFEKVYDWREAKRRWHSLSSNIIRRRPWDHWAVVMQRHKDGGIHFHVFVVHRGDIGTGVDFEAFRRQDYRTAPEALRGEWAFWRGGHFLERYGFGNVNFMPVKDGDALGRYLGRYMGREIGKRREEDAHAQMFHFSRSWPRVVQGDACWADVRQLRAKRRAIEVGTVLWGSQELMLNEVGKMWRYHLRRILWCPDAVYDTILCEAERELRSYDGGLYAIEEAWRRFDKRAKEAAESDAYDRVLDSVTSL
jgi:hypothetical protein